MYFRDALSDLALHFLNKMKIMVIKDIEREDIEFICKVKHQHLYLWKMSNNQINVALICGFDFFFQTIGTKPVAHIDQFTADMLGSAELAEEVSLNGSGKLLKVTILHLNFYLLSFRCGFFLTLQILNLEFVY